MPLHPPTVLFFCLVLAGSGYIEFEEFVSMISKHSIIDDEHELRSAFKKFDRDNSGKISAEELLYLLTSIGKKMTIDEAKQLLAEADLDQDGEIDYNGKIARQIYNKYTYHS